MDREQVEVLREAFEARLRKEELERAVGRASRRRGLPFDAYVVIMSEVRELAKRESISADAAARRLLEEHHEDGK